MGVLWFCGLLAGMIGLVACLIIPFSPLRAPQQTAALVWVLTVLASGWTFAGCVWLLNNPRQPDKPEQEADSTDRKEKPW